MKMTSKEALERIKNTIVIRRNYNRVVSTFNQEEIRIIEKDLEVLEIIRSHKLLNYVLKNPKCAAMYHLTQEEINKLEELENEKI